LHVFIITHIKSSVQIIP